MIGGIVGLLIAAAGPGGDARPYGIILKKNLFAPLPPPAAPPGRQQKPVLPVNKPAPLDDLIAVRGLVYFGEGRPENRIVLEDLKSKAVDSYAAGTALLGARIVEIRRNGALCEYAGEEILISEKGAVRDIPAKAVEVFKVRPAAVLTEMEKDPRRYEALAGTPVVENGVQVGYRIDGIPADTPLGKLGVENGDVITKINGTRLDKPGQPLTAWENVLKYGMERVLVTILRNNKPLHLLYELSYSDD